MSRWWKSGEIITFFQVLGTEHDEFGNHVRDRVTGAAKRAKLKHKKVGFEPQIYADLRRTWDDGGGGLRR
jgi:hypothetical protein